MTPAPIIPPTTWESGPHTVTIETRCGETESETHCQSRHDDAVSEAQLLFPPNP